MESGSRTSDNNDNYRSNAHQPRPRYKFSVEELRVLKECNRESFYYRSLPIASLGAFAVHFAVKQGYLKGHPKYGSTFKILGAAAFGWFLGKVSYRKSCEEKLMKLPNSQFAEMLRKRGGGYTEMLTTDPGVSEKFYTTAPDAKSSPDFDSRRTLSVDKYKQNPGLDDSQRPNLDNSEMLQRLESYESPESEISPGAISSYDELRKRNREEFELKSHGGRRGVPAPPPSAPSSSSYYTAPLPDATRRTTTKGEAKNQYGDVWEE